MSSKRTRSIALSVMVTITVIALGCLEVESQFFTKSSKSIPRMGRRSVESDQKSQLNTYRHLLIDSLVDEYGPDLIGALEQQARAAEENRARSNEVASRNDQPFDFNGDAGDQGIAAIARADRSIARQVKDPRDSLAIRALNTNRYLQHLASGQPLMSYESLFNGGQSKEKQAKNSYSDK